MPIELGAQWIGDTHQRMFRLAAELGVETYPQYDEGETSYDLAGSGVLRENEFHARFACELTELERVLRQLDVLAAEVPVEAPWLAPRATEWDAITAGAWYDAQGLSVVARNLLEICTVGILAVPTAEVSFLHLLFTIQTCGVTSELFAESEGGAQTTRFVGGTSEIPRRLAALIADHIVLEAPVLLIEHTADSVDRALPRRPGGPRTPGHRRDLADAGRPDHVRPATFRRPRPAHPAAAQRLGHEGVLRLRRTLLARRRIQRPAHLRRRPGPDVQRHLHSRRRPRRDPAVPGRRPGAHRRPAPAGERRAAMTAELVRHFGQKAAHPEFYVDGEWSDRQWTRGCYNANHGPHVWTKYGPALTVPIGAIHWASTDTATYWSAYMEGAVDAGERAAQEVIGELVTVIIAGRQEISMLSESLAGKLTLT